MRKTIIVLLTAVLAFSVLAGCGSKKDTLDKVKDKGKLVLGTEATYPPYEFHKSIDGKDTIVGFDIEIAKEIAKDLGLKLVIKDMKFDALLGALDSGNIDIVIAGMTPTPKRAKQVTFSDIYYKAVQSIVVRKEDVDKYKSLDDLAGHKVGAQKGTIQEDIANKQIKNSGVKVLNKVSDLILELQNGRIDAVVAENPVANSYVNHNDDLALSEASPKDDVGGSAIAVKKGSTKMIKEVNKTLKRLADEGKIDQFVAEASELADK